MTDHLPLTAAEMRAAIARDAQDRAAACSAEIEAALKRHNCTIQVEPYLERGLILARAEVVALPAQ